MGVHCVSIRSGPAACVLLAALMFALQATAQAEEARFALTGSTTRTIGPVAQRSATLTLHGRLEPSDAAQVAAPPVQDGGGFALMAKLIAKASVCYNDTIFRNDFDGDGF
jgi:hypothetical protein